MLPDDVLLEIFDSYMDEDMGKVFGPTKKQRIEEWQVLGHVCRRWRNVVFQSPLRLNLRLVCTPETPAKDTLDVWPPLPLIIHDTYRNGKSGVDNIIAALEHNDRVCQIELRCFSSLELGYVTDSAAMQKPFPELTDLHLSMINDDGPIIPDSFLDGTAPCLQSLTLFGVPFPGLPNVLLSATRLVNLSLYHIPLSGYIPPEVMATGISALTSLESLLLQFQYPRPPPAQERRRPPPLPPTRYIIPSLTKVRFKGTSEYLEEILTRIDAPQLDELHITFFNQVIFDTPQLFQFISRRPILRTPKKGHIAFSSRAIIIRFPSRTSYYRVLSVQVPCTASEWQLSSLEQICSSSLPPLFTLEDLYIFEDREYPPRWQEDVENTLWLEVLHLFAAVKNLYLSSEFLSRIAPDLQELVGGRTTEVLPTLENIFLEGFQPSGPLHEGIQKFIAARRLTSCPVAVSRWGMNPEHYKYRYHPFLS